MENKNVAKSVRAKLLNIRNSEPGTEYMQVLLRYIQERMLYRLSMSQYRDNFCLKGSALLFAYEKFKARPTKDIDFLGDLVHPDRNLTLLQFTHEVQTDAGLHCQIHLRKSMLLPQGFQC